MKARGGIARCCLAAMLFTVISSMPVLAQTTGSVNPNTASPGPTGTDEPPPGGCTPIGVTVSGEVVFPFLCRGFIERHKNESLVANKSADGNSVAPAPATAPTVTAPVSALSTPPSVDEAKTAAKQPQTVTPAPSALLIAPVREAAPSKGFEKKRRGSDQGPPGCARSRSYDPVAKTYRDSLGRQRPCAS